MDVPKDRAASAAPAAPGALGRLPRRGGARGPTPRPQDVDADEGVLDVAGWGRRRRRVLIDDSEVLVRTRNWLRVTGRTSGPLFPSPSGSGALRYQSVAAFASLRQAVCPPQFLGRVGASSGLLMAVTIPLGALAGGGLGQHIGTRSAMLAGAIAYSAVGLAASISPLRHAPELSVRANDRAAEQLPEGLTAGG